MKKASVTIALLVGLMLLAATPAQTAPSCGDAVVSDWADGHIEGRYAPRCYGDALNALPEDVRAYSTAEDDIAQALRARIRQLRGRAPANADADAGPPSARLASVPIPLVSGAAIALILGLAGLARFVGLRLRRDRLTHRPTGPVGEW